MSTDPSFYELLGINRDSGPGAVEEAYRQQVLRNHPDHGGNRAVFNLIDHAYQVLRNPERRAAYDDGLDGTPPRGTRIPPSAFGAANAEEASAHYNGEPTSTYSATHVYDDYGDDFIDIRDDDRQGQASDARTQANTGPIYRQPTAADSALPSWVPQGSTVKRAILAIVAVWILIAVFTPVSLIQGMSDGEAILTLAWFVLAWLLLSFALRLAGWSIFAFGLIAAMFFNAAAPDTVIRLAAGFSLWLAGHWIFTWRHEGRWKSSIAFQVLSKLPVAFRPDRKSVQSGHGVVA